MNAIEKSEKDINLRTLRRVDNSIVSIEEFATQVAVYKFSSNINEWERKEVEGSLFIVRRSSIPSYGFVVINRLNTTNMIEAINQNLDLKLEPPYLLYKNGTDIFCIWFYDASECTRVGKRMQDLISLSINDNNNVESKLARLGIKQLVNSNSQQERGNEILSLLQKGSKQVSDRSSLSNGANESVNHSTPNHIGQKVVDIQSLFASASRAQASKPNPLLISNHFKQTPESGQNDQVMKQSASLEDVLTPELLAKQKAKATEADRSPERSPPIIVSQVPPPSVMLRPTPTPSNVNQPLPPLTMEQLKQSMIYLLQNDADFLHLIHSTYYTVFHRQ